MRRNRTLIDIIEDHERDIKRLRQALARQSGGGAIDHGALTGLADDDHTQYWNDARGATGAAAKIAADDLYVKTAGDTMSGDLLVNAQTFLSHDPNSDNDDFTLYLEGGETGTWWSGAIYFASNDSDDSWRVGIRGDKDANDRGNFMFSWNDNGVPQNFMEFEVGAGEIKTYKPVMMSNGTVTEPPLSFQLYNQTGFYMYAGNQVGYTAAGIVRIRMGTGNFYLEGSVTDVRFRGINSFNTTGTAANIQVQTSSTTGRLRRFTSARKYKSRINYNVDYLADIELRPTKHYRKDDGRWFYSFIADDLGDQDELLGVYQDGEIEAFDTPAVMAVMAAKINRLEAEVKELQDA